MRDVSKDSENGYNDLDTMTEVEKIEDKLKE